MRVLFLPPQVLNRYHLMRDFVKMSKFRTKMFLTAHECVKSGIEAIPGLANYAFCFLAKVAPNLSSNAAQFNVLFLILPSQETPLTAIVYPMES